METVAYYLLTATGLGLVWWRMLRFRVALGGSGLFDDDAEVALHLAGHEARSRRHHVAPLHVMYGLLHDATIAAAIRDAGGLTEPVEDRLFAALEGRAKGDDGLEDDLAGAFVWLGRAVEGHEPGERPIGCPSLWACLTLGAPATASLVEAGGVGAAQVLFTLVHGVAETPPELAVPLAREAVVVMINDDISSQELVVELLSSVFELPAHDAVAKMREVHEGGRGVLGCYPVAVARDRVARARGIARARGYPLWIRLEPSDDEATRTAP